MILRAIGISLIIIGIVLSIKGYTMHSETTNIYHGFTESLQSFNYTEYYIQEYDFLGQGDRLHFSYSFSNVSNEWKIKIFIERVATKESWVWEDFGSITNPRSVVFIAPYRGLYILNVTATVIPPTQANLQIAYYQELRNDLIYLYVFLSIIGFFIVLFSFIYDLKGDISWEFKAYYRWVIFVVLSMYVSYIILNFDSVVSSYLIEKLPFIKLHDQIPEYLRTPALALYQAVNIRFSQIWIPLLIFSAIVFLTSFSYEFENGSIRDMLLTANTRKSMFFYKFLSAFLILYLPIILVNIICYIFADPFLLFSNPLFMLSGIFLGIYLKIIT